MYALMYCKCSKNQIYFAFNTCEVVYCYDTYENLQDAQTSMILIEKSRTDIVCDIFPYHPDRGFLPIRNNMLPLKSLHC